MHCPDCGEKCEWNDTSESGKVDCFSCRACENHRQRYGPDVTYIWPWGMGRCDVCGSKPRI